MSGAPRNGEKRLGPGALAALVAGAVLVGGPVAVATTLAAAGATAVALGWDETPEWGPGSATTSADAAAGAPVPSPAASSSDSPSATPARSTSSAPTPTPRPSRTPTTAPARTPAASSTGLVAVVAVVDGDTIKVRVNGTTERVRVIGIDTPELAQRECYAQQASSRMQSLVQSTKVRLVRDRSQDDRDRYGRLLRHVQLADGRQVARILIAGGYGEEYTYDRAYTGQTAYRAAERAARDAGKGIWGSGCRTPVQTAPAAPSGPGSCVIKGNIADDGERIYHVPGQQYYAVTRITESKGERWFCSESAAVDAGWRRSKR